MQEVTPITLTYQNCTPEFLRFKLLAPITLGPITLANFAVLFSDEVIVAMLGNYGKNILPEITLWWESTGRCIQENKTRLKPNGDLVVCISEDNGEPTAFLLNQKTEQKKKIGFLPFHLLNFPVIIDPAIGEDIYPMLYDVLVGLINGFTWVHAKKGFKFDKNTKITGLLS